MILSHTNLFLFTAFTSFFSHTHGIDVPTFRQTTYAALGDSYASGDGAGSSKLLPHFDIACGRFSDAYPVQVANSTFLDIPESGFRNLACGGSSTLTVLRNQLPNIGDSQIVTLTVGGNEVDFFTVLNECVYQWRPFGTCDDELVRSRSIIESARFIKNYDTMMRGIVQHLPRSSRLLVTGYATFFNQHTEQCNGATFSKTDPQNMLSIELRTRFNDLVRLLNNIIQAASGFHGAEYVDLEELFDTHRFCEEGVIEPALDRTDTWFFTTMPKVEKGAPPVPGENDQQLIERGPAKDFLDLTKVFHPTERGHTAIANEILRHIERGQ